MWNEGLDKGERLARDISSWVELMTESLGT